MTQPATDLEIWERGRQEALASLMEALEVPEADVDADPLALLPHLNRLVADQDYDGFDQDDWLYLHSMLAAFIADVLIRKYGATWRLRHDARGPNYMLVTRGYDAGEYEVSPMDVVYHGLQDLPPDRHAHARHRGTHRARHTQIRRVKQYAKTPGTRAGTPGEGGRMGQIGVISIPHELPEWQPFDADALARIAAPDGAVTALTRRGLPDNAYQHFTRVPARELEVADLPGCGPAAFLAQVWDGFNNSYWLSLGDGSVWMRYGRQDGPAEFAKRINTCVPALQAVLEAWCAFDGPRHAVENDPPAYERLLDTFILDAVRADPEVYTDPEGWWPRTLEEAGYTGPRFPKGEAPLYEYVSRDGTGAWIIEHPGYEED
ncbi:MAG TPA: SUKH-4 family immunity protein [Actinospica sp.]|nr:SUKH-4 family immunity protein [Actinospica sp.]